MGRRQVAASGGKHGEIFWKESQDTFAYKMMTGMGWKQGEGLGKDSSGITQYVRAKQKKDNSGIGLNIRQKEEEAFRATQDLFGDVLKRLNEQHSFINTETEMKDEPKVHKSTSAAIKSYLSGRTLYNKFKQSKNTSSYSSQNMSEIFGRKTEEKIEKVEIVYGQKKTTTITREKDEMDTLLVSGGNMKDFFKKSKQTRQTRTYTSSNGDFQQQMFTEMNELAHSGRKGLGFGRPVQQAQVIYPPSMKRPKVVEVEESETEQDKSHKKKKKSKKSKKESSSSSDEDVKKTIQQEEEESSKKKKKSKRKQMDSSSDSEDAAKKVVVEEEAPIKKSKKSKKSKKEKKEEEPEEEVVVKKSKKNKKRKLQQEDEEQEDSTSKPDKKHKKKKKSKKN